MTEVKRDTVIQDGLAITGSISNGRLVEIHGYVEGELSAETVLVHETGRVYGRVNAVSAEIAGAVQGEITVTNLLNIGASGSVVGNVEYGQLAMAQGGELSADVRNIPPQIGGDLDLTVDRGRSVTITQTDLTAHDPDDLPQDLTYTVSNALHGFIAFSGAPAAPVTHFTQADLLAGKVSFVHNGTGMAAAGFDVVVADASGGNSGPAQSVKVAVRGQPAA